VTEQRPRDDAERRDAAVGEHLPRVARAALADVDQLTFARLARAREQRRRDEERQQDQRRAEGARAERERADDERGDRAAARERVRAQRAERDQERDERSEAEIGEIQAVTPASSARIRPSIVNSSATTSTAMP
jgi:hypothetical protein